jgi:hypothetical protein
MEHHSFEFSESRPLDILIDEVRFAEMAIREESPISTSRSPFVIWHFSHCTTLNIRESGREATMGYCRLISFAFASLMMISCCDVAREPGASAGETSLLMNAENKRRVTQLDGSGEFSNAELDGLMRESRFVTRARISSFFSYSNATFPTDHGLVDYHTLCITFAINPKRDVYKGWWPSAGMILEDCDVAHASNGTDKKGNFGFYAVDDEYLVFMDGPTPMDSNVIKIRHITVHEKKN